MLDHRKQGNILLFLAPVGYLLVTVIVVITVASHVFPIGSDTMYHIYRGNLVYEAALSGNWWSMLDPMWYNGVEIMRYWAPLPAYFMAACQALGGGDPMEGYLLFVGLICFLGALPWFYMGRKIERPWLGALLGILWFFMPNNLTALFVEGNLARSVSMIFLPLFVFNVYRYLEDWKWGYLPRISLWFALISLCHLGYAGMVALAMLVFFVIYGFLTGAWRQIGETLCAMLFGIMVLGIWVLPSLVGGITNIDSSETMVNFFQSAWISLNPLERIESGNIHFYFGLAALILAVFGGLFSNRRSAAGFWCAVVIFICTTTSMYPVMRMLPGSQYLWMLRFISIALCLILYAFLSWDTLKKPFVILMCVLLCADTIPSLTLISGKGEYSALTVEERLDEQQEYTLIAEGQTITEQRMALMDESTLESMGAWLVSAWNQPVAGTFGAGWEAAVTSGNISQLNRALTGGSYYYLFDRCEQLGNDTVVIRLSRLPLLKEPIEELDAAAAAVGYSLIEDNSAYRLYHLDGARGNWGTADTYRAIAIGSQAYSIALQFPAMREVSTTNLNDFTYEELSSYDIVYLAGFTYEDRQQAEQLILDLSESGTRVIIAADGIPEDRENRSQSFLGVRCNVIEFKNGYPELDTIDGVLYTDMFPSGYTDWKTVYLDGLDESWGTVYDGDLRLDFYGTVQNENIVVVGLNLTFFYGLTRDPSVGELLSHAMQLSPAEVPRREIVPLTVEYTNTSITISSPRDDVNTTLSYHNIFQSDRELTEENRLLKVDAGTTDIQLEYPYLWQGILLSAAGVLLMAAQWIMAAALNRRSAKAAQALTEGAASQETAPQDDLPQEDPPQEDPPSPEAESEGEENQKGEEDRNEENREDGEGQ